MQWDELSDAQKHDMKEAYIIRLADEGKFVEVIYGDGSEERGPSWGELANADKLIPDDVMRDQGVDYMPEDCPSSSPDDLRLFTPEFVHDWCNRYITQKKYMEAKDMLAINFDISQGMLFAKDMVQSLCERFAKGQLTEEEVKMLHNKDIQEGDGDE